MVDLGDLYHQVVLEHSKNPRFRCEQQPGLISSSCYNPLCGDKIEIYCAHDQGRLIDLRFSGEGCAISIAAASLMAEALQSAHLVDIYDNFDWYRAMVMGQDISHKSKKLAKLAVMQGVSRYPMRVKCATCAWHALLDALPKQTGVR